MEVNGRLDAPAVFPPGEVPIDFEAGSAAGPLWTSWRGQISLSNHYYDNVCRSKYFLILYLKASSIFFVVSACLLD
jgi:hypothetical protein